MRWSAGVVGFEGWGPRPDHTVSDLGSLNLLNFLGRRSQTRRLVPSRSDS